MVGDYALTTLCDIFSDRMRTSDIFARWGGEEFVILLPSTDVNKAEKFANSLREALSDYGFDHFGRLSCSFGVTQLIKGDNAQNLLERADSGLYYSKKHGKDMVTLV